MEAVVVGQGPILGRPLSAVLTARGATVTSCHVLTRDLQTYQGAGDSTPRTAEEVHRGHADRTD